MYAIYTAVLCAGLPSTYVQEALYAGFAGAKTGHEKILLNRCTLWLLAGDFAFFAG